MIFFGFVDGIFLDLLVIFVGFVRKLFRIIFGFSTFMYFNFGFLDNFFHISVIFPSNDNIVARVPRPERPKGAKDDVKEARRASTLSSHVSPKSRLSFSFLSSICDCLFVC